MLLAIDVGNTNVVLGCFEGSRLKRTWRVSTHPICTADEFRVKLAALFELDGIDAKELNAVAVSSVVPKFTAMLRYAFETSLIRASSPVPLHNIDHRAPYSFTIKADPASSVGADRLVNAEAAILAHGAPAIVVDSGTATTICAISRNREYLGGAILAGIDLSIEALTRNTAKLYAVELVPPPSVIGGNTQDAIRSGVLFGYASMLDEMVRKFKLELREPNAPVIATGGVSERLKGLTRELTHFDADLTLKGIASLVSRMGAKDTA